MIPKLNFKQEKRERKGINASEYGGLGINIILALNHFPQTNPMIWSDTLRLGAGKGVELEMVKRLKENGIIAEDFDQEEVPTMEIIREGVPIRMKFDAIALDCELKMENSLMPQTETIKINAGECIEIKSINNKNSIDIQKYIDNKPRESYVGQLAIYMDALEKEQGHLFVASLDGLNTFWFVCKKIGERIYQCGDTVVDLNKEYARFAKIWAAKDNPLLWKEYIWEEIYKLPLEQIDWTKLSVTKIGDVRNGRFVVGSENKWKLDYSDYKDYIVQQQGATPGYSDEELALIKAKTAGFSAKKPLVKSDEVVVAHTTAQEHVTTNESKVLE